MQAVAVLNNSISSELARQDLAAMGIRLDRTVLILIRDVREPWMDECAKVLRYPGKPSGNLAGQRRFLDFYCAAARLLRQLERTETLRNIYIVNNDNLVTSHLLAMVKRNPSLKVTVVAEGLMNFQEIGTANRAGWRWQVKPVIARLLGFRYTSPRGHLSGSFEPQVSRVVSFAREGLKSPPDKVVIRTFRTVTPRRRSDPSIALVVLTGLNEWMDPERFRVFAHAFVEWVRRSGYRKIQIKRHPRVSAGLIEDLLADAEEIGQGAPVEAVAENMEAGTVLGTCCTALVTLKLIRPDLRCIDFGSDYYQTHAYGGDRSVETLFYAAGVEVVHMNSKRTIHDERRLT